MRFSVKCPECGTEINIVIVREDDQEMKILCDKNNDGCDNYFYVTWTIKIIPKVFKFVEVKGENDNNT